MQLEAPISTAGATKDRSKQDAYAPIFARLLPPKAASLAEERRRREVRLAGGLRIFAALGFAEGVAGHITARDPEFADTFWVDPSKSFHRSLQGPPRFEVTARAARPSMACTS
jgi:hypothetical protein